jgi:hypothetical protein
MGIKTFFRQGEMTALLKSCTTGLDQAVGVFMVISISVPVYELITQHHGRLTVSMWSRISLQ